MATAACHLNQVADGTKTLKLRTAAWNLLNILATNVRFT